MIYEISLVLEMFSVIIMLYSLYYNKIRIDIYNILLITTEVIGISFVYYLNLSQMWTLGVYTFVLVFCILEFGFDLRKLIINNVLNVVLLFGLQLLGAYLFYLMFSYENQYYQLLFVNAFVLLCAALIKFFIPIHKFAEYIQTKEYSVVIIIGSVSLIIIGYQFYYKMNRFIYSETLV